MKGQLLTQDQIACMGLLQQMTCPFCPASIESLNHWIFRCPFSPRIWQPIIDNCCLRVSSGSWSFYHSLGKLCLPAAVYYIWQAHNYKTFQHLMPDPWRISARIRTIVELMPLICQPRMTLLINTSATPTEFLHKIWQAGTCVGWTGRFMNAKPIAEMLG